MKVLIIDNYDSFTYNLYQYIGEYLENTEEKFQIDVFRNDEISINEIKETEYSNIVISPGPGDPSDIKYFGVCAQILSDYNKNFTANKPAILAVCLGMQGMAHYFGGKVIRAERPMHGKISLIDHDNNGLFYNLPQKIEVMRYHSLVVEEKSLPSCLSITAKASGTNEIMGLRHKNLPIEGIQFHPESFATEGGKIMIENFFKNI